MKAKSPTIMRFDDQQIASITEPFPNEDGIFDVRLVSKGMTEEQIKIIFPPTKQAIAKARKNNKPEPTFNMRLLLRSILVEEYEKIGGNRQRGNVRHLFYTNVIYVITRIMKVTNTSSVNTTLNKAWQDVIRSGIITYEGMNVESGKSNWLKTFAQHSPFSNFIICVEKSSLLDSLSWIAELFTTTIITAEGQPSRSAIRAFIRSLNNWKCDLNKPFQLLVITDLDPAGWYIQESFASQIENAINYYNDGEGSVEPPNRLFLKLEQVTDNLLNEFAIPAKDKEAKTSQAKKSSDTKIKRFKDKLGDKWTRLYINGEMMKVELDAITDIQMEKKIISELLEVIDDHSLILIPEIMGEVENQRNNVIKDFFNTYKEKEIDSIIDEYLEPIDNITNEIKADHNIRKKQSEKDYQLIVYDTNHLKRILKSEIRDISDPIIDKYFDYAESFVTDEREEIEKNNKKIQDLYDEIADLEDENTTIEETIEEIIGFYTEEIDNLKEDLSRHQNNIEDRKHLLLEPFKKIKDGQIAEIERIWKIYQDKLTSFKSQQEGKFGSYLRSVEKQFQNSLNSEIIPIFFSDIEFDSNIQTEMSYLLTSPKLLVKENKSCIEHPKPAFKESDLLQNALNSDNLQDTKRNPDLSKFRNAFSEPFKQSLKDFMNNKLSPIEIKLDAVIDKPEEYTNELETLIQEITDEIKTKKLYLFLNYHPEDMKSLEEEE